MTYELIMMDPEGHRLACKYSRNPALLREKALALLEDYPRCFCRLYAYKDFKSEPIRVEVIR